MLAQIYDINVKEIENAAIVADDEFMMILLEELID